MKTLLVEQRGNQHYSDIKPRPAAQFGSLPFHDFGVISRRHFQSGVGLLPTPLKASTTPITKQGRSSFNQTPLLLSNLLTDDAIDTKTIRSSTPIPINAKVSYNDSNFSGEIGYGSFSYSELWAGPAYSNSPPPSSLPIPNFSIRPKRTVSLNLPGSAPEVKMHPIAKSAPSSPTSDSNSFDRDIFGSADSARKTLCRLLNLEFDND